MKRSSSIDSATAVDSAFFSLLGFWFLGPCPSFHLPFDQQSSFECPSQSQFSHVMLNLRFSEVFLLQKFPFLVVFPWAASPDSAYLVHSSLMTQCLASSMKKEIRSSAFDDVVPSMVRMYQTLKRGNPQRWWWQAARNIYGKLVYLWTWPLNPESAPSTSTTALVCLAAVMVWSDRQ